MGKLPVWFINAAVSGYQPVGSCRGCLGTSVS